MNNGKNPAVETAKSVFERANADVTLADGRKGRVVSVAVSLIDSVTSLIKDPEPPMWHNTDKDRDEPNPADPHYLKALQDTIKERSLAAVDAMIMFGVILVDGMPEDDSWLDRLKYLERRGRISLEGYDLDDKMDREFLYKKYVAVDNVVLTKIGSVSGIAPEDIQKAEESFRGN